MSVLLGWLLTHLAILAGLAAKANVVQKVSPPGSDDPVAFYTSLLPPSLGTEALEEESFLRRYMAGSNDTVHVIEEHNQALRWWLRALHGAAEALGPDAEKVVSKRRLVVHFDTHLDVGTYPWGNWDELGVDAKIDSTNFARARGEVAQLLVRSMHPGNYIGAGVVAGLVSDVIWVRGSWPNSRYNGPPPGHYQVGFYLCGDGFTWAAAVCQEILESNPSATDAIEEDQEAGIGHGSFESCEQMSMYTMKIQRPAFATFNLTVTTLQNLAVDAGEVLRESGTDIQEWLLDIDEDYFACHAPPLPFFNGFLKDFGKNDHTRLKDILEKLGKACNANEGHRDLFWLMEQLPRQRGEGWENWKGGEAKCKLPTALKRELTAFSRGFSPKQQEQWSKAWHAMYTDTFVLDKFRIFYPFTPQPAPEHTPSKSELASLIKSFGGAVQTLAGQLGQPSVVTLCRSLLNGFLPRRSWPAVEQGVKKALQKALNSSTLTLVEDLNNPQEASHRLPKWVSKAPHRGRSKIDDREEL